MEFSDNLTLWFSLGILGAIIFIIHSKYDKEIRELVAPYENYLPLFYFIIILLGPLVVIAFIYDTIEKIFKK